MTMNQFNESEMAVITASLLTTARTELKGVRNSLGDKQKCARHRGFARNAISLYRKIAKGSNDPGMMNGYMDDVLKKFEDVFTEGGENTNDTI